MNLVFGKVCPSFIFWNSDNLYIVFRFFVAANPVLLFVVTLSTPQAQNQESGDVFDRAAFEKRVVEAVLKNEKEKELEREAERLKEKEKNDALIATMVEMHKRELEEKFKEKLDHVQRTAAMDVVMGRLFSFSFSYCFLLFL
jgi:hypothetical protein